MESVPYFCPILDKLWSFNMFTEVSNTKFHENPSSRSRVYTSDRQTDMTKLNRRFSRLWERAYKLENSSRKFTLVCKIIITCCYRSDKWYLPLVKCFTLSLQRTFTSTRHSLLLMCFNKASILFSCMYDLTLITGIFSRGGGVKKKKFLGILFQILFPSKAYRKLCSFPQWHLLFRCW